LNLSLEAEDPEGDDVSCQTNRTDNLNCDAHPKMDLVDDFFMYHPDNDHIGDVYVNLSVIDTNGGFRSYEILIHVSNVNSQPLIKITTPVNHMHFPEGSKITFSCESSDPDFEIPGYNESLYFTWTSNKQSKPLGSGKDLTTLTGVKLKPGTHVITVNVRDAGGATNYHTVTIIVDEEESAFSNLASSPASMALVIILIIIIVIVLFLLLFKKKFRRTEGEYLPSGERKPADLQPSAPAAAPMTQPAAAPPPVQPPPVYETLPQAGTYYQPQVPPQQPVMDPYYQQQAPPPQPYYQQAPPPQPPTYPPGPVGPDPSQAYQTQYPQLGVAQGHAQPPVQTPGPPPQGPAPPPPNVEWEQTHEKDASYIEVMMPKTKPVDKGKGTEGKEGEARKIFEFDE
jgi:hypothetical protein